MSLNFFKIFWVCFFINLAESGYCQNDTILTNVKPKIQNITQQNIKHNRWLFINKQDNGLPIPKNSFILSMVVPGAGQAYNGKWWKVPIVYGALGFMVYLIDFNTDNYTLFRDAYKRKLQDLPHRFTGSLRFDNASVLKNQRDKYDKQRQLSYVGITLIWAANGLEAFTNAHLLDFDVSDDLSIKLTPEMYQVNQETIVGLGAKIRF